jgi:hypothetical protein
MDKPTYTMKLTASEAKKISGLTAEEEVAAIEDRIEKAAKEKKRQIELKSDFWISEGYDQTEKYLKACGILENNGYTVKFFYEELQFVNMYTIVSW